MVHFTDEEMYGKFLDLHELHDIYCNLKGVEVREGGREGVRGERGRRGGCEGGS